MWHELKKMQVFYSDRGNDYDNALIDNALSTFKIEKSLSNKGNPYDNVVSEATDKI